MREVILLGLAYMGAKKIIRELGNYAIVLRAAGQIKGDVAKELLMAIDIIEREQKKAVKEKDPEQYRLEVKRVLLLQAYQKLSKKKGGK